MEKIFLNHISKKHVGKLYKMTTSNNSSFYPVCSNCDFIKPYVAIDKLYNNDVFLILETKNYNKNISVKILLKETIGYIHIHDNFSHNAVYVVEIK